MKRADVALIGVGPAGLGFALRHAAVSGASLLAFDGGGLAQSRRCTVYENMGCKFAEPCEVTSGIGGLAAMAGGKVSGFPAGSGFVDEVGRSDIAERVLLSALELLRSYLPLREDCATSERIAQESAWFMRRGFEFRYYPAFKYAQRDMVSAIGAMADFLRTRANVEIRSNTRVTRVTASDEGDGFLLEYTDAAGVHTVRARRIVIATGRSGGNLLRELGSRDLETGFRPTVDVGLRLELPTSSWPLADSCHNDLKLHFGNARTFCASRDGWIAPYRNENHFLVEGRTDLDEASGFTNIAISRRLPIQAAPLTNHLRKRLEEMSKGAPVRQRLQHYLTGTDPEPRLASNRASSTISYWRWGNLRDLYPPAVSKQVAGAVEYFVQRLIPDAIDDASLYGPEFDYYWRTIRTRGRFSTSTPGIHAIGDVVGKHRGILQAFASGYLLAEDLAEQAVQSA